MIRTGSIIEEMTEIVMFFFLVAMVEARWMRKEKRKEKKKRLLRGHIHVHVRPDQRDATNDDDQTTLEGALNVIHRQEIDPEPIKKKYKHRE